VTQRPLQIIAYSDGGARGNPGPAACAAVLLDSTGDELLSRSRMLGSATNNVAEYGGVILALELCAQLGASDVKLRVDSELIARQMTGQYKVKNVGLRPLYERAKRMSREFSSFSIEHVPREQNKVADKLVNEALDGD